MSSFRDNRLGAIEVDGMTRGGFLLRGTLAVAGAYGAAAAGPYVARTLAQGGSDLDILGFALTLELLEAEFYRRAVADAKLGGEVRKLAEGIERNEREHAETLRETLEGLGGRPPPPPRFRFDVRNEREFLRTAVRLEDTGVAAYNGAAPAIRSKDLLIAAGSIAQVEARHAAAVRRRAGQDPAPRPFDEGLDRQRVLQAVRELAGS